MAIDVFIKIRDIKGESTRKGLEGAIDVFSYSFGVQNTRGAAPGSGAAAGRPEFTDLSVVVPQSAATIPLVQSVASGKRLPDAYLYVVDPRTGQTRYTLKLEDVLITSLHEAGSAADDRPTNAMSLSFLKWEAVYKVQRPDGQLGDSVEGGGDAGTKSG